MYLSNASVFSATNAASDGNRNAPRPSRYRERDFGTGYGASSGYAAARSYPRTSQPAPRFRLV